MVGERRDDRFGDFGHPDGLRAGRVAAARHHVERQPRGVGDTDVLRLRQLCRRRRQQERQRETRLQLIKPQFMERWRTEELGGLGETPPAFLAF